MALLQCFSLHTFISELVASQVDFFYGLVDPKRFGEGLQSWHKAKAQWTANLWAFYCSCAELPALSTGSSACLPFWIVRHRGPQVNSVSLSQLRRSLQLLITDSTPAQFDLSCDDLVQAQRVGQALEQNVQRNKTHIDQGTDIWKTEQMDTNGQKRANHRTLQFPLDRSDHCELLGAFAKTQFTGLLILC